MMQRTLSFGLCLILLASLSIQAQPAKPAVQRLEPVAETKLIMNGFLEPNFSGLGTRLKDRPADDETWTIVRGQSLLVAEGGNLLLMRPPKTRAAQDAWMAKAAELRDAGVKLANAAARKDYVAARAGAAMLANACNRCHESTGVKNRVEPFSP